MRLVVSLFVLILVALPVTTYGQVSASIANTPHNLNNVPGLERADGQICIPCHTPHNAMTMDNGDSMVLWNHELTGETFTMYSPLMSGRTIDGQPEGSSKLCLSCHDGVTAIDNYGGATGGTVKMGDLPGGAQLAFSSDLRDDHPIGITYPEGTEGYNDSSGFVGVQLVEINGEERVECTSCHDPHNNSLGWFLRRTVTGSSICLECHNK